MSEPIGNAEDFGRMLAGTSKHEPAVTGPSESADLELDDDQRELANRYDLPPLLVTRVRGETWPEKCEDAEKLAKLVHPEPPPVSFEGGPDSRHRARATRSRITTP
jgi:hypothetical protein